MPDQTVSSGSTVQIISQSEAEDVADVETDTVGFIIDVSSDDIRITVADEKQFARSGFPIPAGTTFTLDPQGNGIVAYGDGSGASTVSVQRQKFVIGDIGP